MIATLLAAGKVAVARGRKPKSFGLMMGCHGVHRHQGARARRGGPALAGPAVARRGGGLDRRHVCAGRAGAHRTGARPGAGVLGRRPGPGQRRDRMVQGQSARFRLRAVAARRARGLVSGPVHRPDRRRRGPGLVADPRRRTDAARASRATRGRGRVARHAVRVRPAAVRPGAARRRPARPRPRRPAPGQRPRPVRAAGRRSGHAANGRCPRRHHPRHAPGSGRAGAAAARLVRGTP